MAEQFQSLKWIFDRVVAFFGLLFLWPVLLIVDDNSKDDTIEQIMPDKIRYNMNLKAIWQFCSYLFWPQWGSKRRRAQDEYEEL